MFDVLEALKSALRDAVAGTTAQEVVFAFLVPALLAFGMLRSLLAVRPPSEEEFVSDTPGEARAARAASILGAVLPFLLGAGVVFAIAYRSQWPTVPDPRWEDQFVWPPDDWLAWWSPLLLVVTPLLGVSVARRRRAWIGWLLEAGLAAGLIWSMAAPVADARWPSLEGRHRLWLLFGLFVLHRLHLGVQARGSRGIGYLLGLSGCAAITGLLLGSAGSALAGKILSVWAAVLGGLFLGAWQGRLHTSVRGIAAVHAWVTGFAYLYAFSFLSDLRVLALAFPLGGPLALGMRGRSQGAWKRLGWGAAGVLLCWIASLGAFAV